MSSRKTVVANPDQPAAMNRVSTFSPMNGSTPVSLNAQRILATRPAHPPQPLSEDEYNALLAAAESTPESGDLLDVLAILYHTSLRVDELCRLRWKAVKFRKRYMMIHSRKNGQRRRVPFASKVLQVLRARKRREPDAAFVLGTFPERTLKQVVTQLSTLSPSIRKPPITLRALRLTFIARWFRAGGSLAQLGLIAGIFSSLRASKSMISGEHAYPDAAEFQARLEEADDRVCSDSPVTAGR